MKIILSILLIMTFLSIFSQDKIEANCLIPYNNGNGKWGWCDTLGIVKIKPKYQKVGFFYKTVDSTFESYIEINNNENRLVYGKGLKIPKKYSIKNELYYKNEKGQDLGLFQISHKNNLGIFDNQSKKFILKPIYNSLILNSDENLNLLFRRKGETKYSLLRYDNGYKFETTDIISVEEWNHTVDNYYSEQIQLYLHEDSSWTKLVDNIHVIETFKEGKWDQNEWFFEAPDFNEDNRINNKSNVDGIIDSYDYSKLSGIKQEYGFSFLKIVREDGKMGILNENDSIIVPFDYDKIYFNSNFPYSAKLIKNNKEGIKLFFTNYQIIPSKYDQIINFDYPEKLEITKKWSFAVYKISLNGQIGYVGENGIEYFNFK